MKTNINPNSIEVYHSTVKDKLEIPQNELVLKKIEVLGTATGRMLSEITGIVPGQVSRVIDKLRKDNKILFAYTDKCRISNKKADYWKLPSPNINSQNQFLLF